MQQGSWNLKEIAVCVPHRGKRASDARISSVFIGLGVVPPRVPYLVSDTVYIRTADLRLTQISNYKI